MTPIRQIKQNYRVLIDFFWVDRAPLDRLICLPFFGGALLGYTVYAIVVGFFLWSNFEDKK